MSSHLELIDEILEASSQDVNATFELLEKYFEGAPVESLVTLLKSRNIEAVRMGAFIASELAVKARPVRRDIADAMRWSDRKIRFDAIDALVTTTNEADGPILARVVELASTDDEAVRWQVSQFLSQISISQIEAARRCCEGKQLATLMSWLVTYASSTRRPSADEVCELLRSIDPVRRVFGWAAVCRFKSVPEEIQGCISLGSHDDVAAWSRDDFG